jgi:hypothetical protein
MDMDLLQNIRTDRARQRRKQPHERKVFNTVSCIVKRHGLSESFLRLPNQTVDSLSQKRVELSDIKTKEAFEFAPFSLLSKEEYGVAMAIVGKLDNPYLPFAHSPEEMLLSVTLYEANPLLRSDHLLCHHFETLLLCQHAKEELVDLERRLRNFNGTVAQGRGVEETRGEPPQWSSLQEQMKQLRTFITKVEETGS